MRADVNNRDIAKANELADAVRERALGTYRQLGMDKLYMNEFGLDLYIKSKYNVSTAAEFGVKWSSRRNSAADLLRFADELERSIDENEGNRLAELIRSREKT